MQLVDYITIHFNQNLYFKYFEYLILLVKHFNFRNPEMKTIEEDLLTALLKAKLITDEAFAQVQTIQFQRAARTDKGVSAARQVVSLKLREYYFA